MLMYLLGIRCKIKVDWDDFQDQLSLKLHLDIGILQFFSKDCIEMFIHSHGKMVLPVLDFS